MTSSFKLHKKSHGKRPHGNPKRTIKELQRCGKGTKETSQNKYSSPEKKQ
jgi:hypothetical protein